MQQVGDTPTAQQNQLQASSLILHSIAMPCVSDVELASAANATKNMGHNECAFVTYQSKDANIVATALANHPNG